MLKEAKGNMYSFVTHTKNYVKGKCPHDCSYCYMKVFDLKPMRFDKNELREDMGEGKFIFVGSSCDMWADEVPSEWIYAILDHCFEYNENRYLFQSKNPSGFISFCDCFPDKVVLGTTIETNRIYGQMGKTPVPCSRVTDMAFLAKQGFETMVTIEPIMDFNHEELVKMITDINPSWVNIGADSKGHHLPEPTANKIKNLIGELSQITEVKIKSNLKRIYQ